ncbi:hypothetical protein [Roseicitreum antarcticum]|uniref:LPS sulfotransferase NodH n=1 Tax=Roseicitreum antarcticum TaxID=564137 RepID=A0A1H2X872_9RHOB|nr:hypothetical protein [Roseicitreum antarcticum]SDW88459.1 hypothetical protein SAMN04488238_10484 [Roseicitreum antarcticum]
MTFSAPFTSFVVLADMRTGSNLLESNLNEFDGIVCEGELFNPNFINRPDVSHVEGFDRAARDTDPLPLLAAVQARPGMNGFRFFHDHDPRILAHVLEDPACAKIVLSRNPLDSYVSLKIATTTNQWRLGHVKDRKAAKVTFDATEFRAHADRVQRFQAQVQQQLQASGQVAFPIAYEDLNDVAVLNGLARWLGVAATITAPSTRLKRQNPEPIEDKLTNPEALHAFAGGMGGAGPAPHREPRHAPAAPMFRIASHSPLAFLPIPGGPDQKIYHWLAELDGVSPEMLVTDLGVEDMRRWWLRTPGHHSFTVLRHPTARAFEIFLRQVLSGARGDVVRWLAEVEQTDVSPLDTLDDQPPEVLRADFLAFLRFLKANRAGQTPMVTAPAWTSQVTCLRALAEVCPPRFVLKESDLVPACAQLAAIAGKAAPPAPAAHTPSRRRLSRIYDATVLAATQEVYTEDFMLLGFGDWVE